MSKYHIDVDGCTYEVEVSLCQTTVEVYDSTGVLIADAEHDSVMETLCYTHYDTDGSGSANSECQKDLYEKNWREVATWLVATHPDYQ